MVVLPSVVRPRNFHLGIGLNCAICQSDASSKIKVRSSDMVGFREGDNHEFGNCASEIVSLSLKARQLRLVHYTIWLI